MNPVVNRKKLSGILWIRRHPVKLTALLYLREALLEERYEECAEIVAIAREFGAAPIEIRLLLEDPRRTPRA